MGLLLLILLVLLLAGAFYPYGSPPRWGYYPGSLVGVLLVVLLVLLILGSVPWGWPARPVVIP